MRNYEVTFIVDPVLSGDEIKATAKTYIDQLTSLGATVVYVNEMGLRQLAYNINRRTTGIYYCVEYSAPNGDLISKLELAMRRDERIMRFLTVSLDKYGVKFNDDNRNGLIGKKRKAKTADAPATTPAPAKAKAKAKTAAPAPAAKAAVATPPAAEAKAEEE